MITTIKQHAGVAYGLPPLPTLRVVYSAHMSREVQQPQILRSGATAIGRDPQQPRSIPLPKDGRVSRLHATLHVDSVSNTSRVVDEGSTNGTFVNGQRLQEASLKDGDVLRVGDTLMVLRYESPGDEDAPIEGLLGHAPSVRALRSTIR